jgi:hypothetical protein
LIEYEYEPGPRKYLLGHKLIEKFGAHHFHDELEFENEAEVVLT